MRIALLLLGCGLAFAQSPSSPAIRINVNLVQVDAVVTDSKGRHISNLTADDFLVLQDGKPQTISNFSYVTGGSPIPPPKPQRAAPKGAPGPLAPALTPAEVRRTFALVVDDVGLSFARLAYVRDALRQFVDQQMVPGDMVAIIPTSGGLGVLQQFTNDKALLHAAIDHLKIPLTRLVSPVAAMGVLRYVIDGLADLPGRKSVVLFSQNMGQDPADPLVSENLRRILEAANRASVVIYTINPRGLRPIHLSGARKPRANGAPDFYSEQGLVTLAEETGGLFIHNNNDIGDAIHQAIADSEGYYLIGYHPAAATFDSKTEEPAFHRLQVKLRTKGLQVRSRSGFFGESNTEARPVPGTGHEKLLRALLSPFGSGDVHVRLTALFEQSLDGHPFIDAMLHIDAKDLQFTPREDGRQGASVEVEAMSFGSNGQPVDGRDRHFNIALDAQQYASAMSDGLVYRVNLPLQRPGMYQVRVALRDDSSGQLGSASQLMQTSDLSKGQLALSSILLAGAAETVISPTVRIFQSGEALSYRYTIFNAQGDAAGKTELQVETRIFRDGQEVYRGQPIAPDLAGQTDRKRLVAGGNMVLAKGIPPGDYALQVIVTDGLSNQKDKTASQWTDFEIKE